MIYENAKTLSDEQSVANLIATLWHVRMTKPPGYGRDRIIHDSEGRPIGVLEIKVRTNAWRRYPTYMIDLAKVAGMRSEVERGMVALLAVKFTDWLGYVDMTEWRWIDGKPDGFAVATGGRRDRNDPNDIDRCVFIPIDRFVSAQYPPRWRYT
jgi:hypothetical protein